MPFGGVGNTFHRSQRDKLPRFRNLEKTGAQLAFADVKTQNKHKTPQKGKNGSLPESGRRNFVCRLVRLEYCCA